MSSIYIEEDIFGCHTSKKTNTTTTIKRFTLTNQNNISVQLITYGATITSIKMPDDSGNIEDIVLGYNDMTGYYNSLNPYFGASIGRVGNRIRDAKFKIKDAEFKVSQNSMDSHHIHGGVVGFDKVNWDSYIKGAKVIMSYLSKDGEEGYPGNLLVNLTFELTKANELFLNYLATTTKPTIVNLTHHSYFNLAGHTTGSKELYKHIVSINADCITEIDENLLPNGNIISVRNSIFDLRLPKMLGNIIHKLPEVGGFDHNFCTNKVSKQDVSFVAKVAHPPSRRGLEVYSNQPGVQFYTTNSLTSHEGKKGKYSRHGAFCLEAQNYPDAINQKKFPNSILYPGEIYRNVIIYKFTFV